MPTYKDESSIMTDMLNILIETRDSSVRNEENVKEMRTDIESLNNEVVDMKTIINDGFEKRDTKISKLKVRTNILTVAVAVSFILLLFVMSSIFEGVTELAGAALEFVRGLL